VLFLYALQRFQPRLPLSLGFPGVAPAQAWNTAASFVTNTNWQSYSGESTMGHLVQMVRDWQCRTSRPPPSAWPSRWR
jgi:K+-transporting ATPase ATPase A chain